MLIVDRVRTAIESVRRSEGGPAEVEQIAAGLVRALVSARPRCVVNATGVLLHTNLGRAPWSDNAVQAAVEAGVSYGNVEFDRLSGGRGRRGGYVAELLVALTGAEAGLVVNNNAAAVFLILSVLGGATVPVSRGELVEIGGSYRLPELMTSAGVQLREVGTTNRTRISDYKQAVDDSTGLILKVHQSNYRIVGFTEDVTVPQLAELAGQTGLPLVFDAGSGLLDSTTPWLDNHPPAWLAGEPGVRQAVVEGADLVCFSGDKLLGGPQAGIVVGRQNLVDQLRGSPIARALRPDGVTLAGLAATLEAYADRRVTDIPLWRMATNSFADLESRAERLLADSGVVGSVVDGVSVLGAGSSPGGGIPTPEIELDGSSDRIYTSLLAWETPVVSHRVEGKVRINLRAVDTADDTMVSQALVEACRS